MPITISSELEIARLDQEIMQLREQLAAANSFTARQFIDFFRGYMEANPGGAFTREHDDDIEPFFRSLTNLTQDHVFHRLVEAAGDTFPSDTAAAIKAVRIKIAELKKRFDDLAVQIVDACRGGKVVGTGINSKIEGGDARFQDMNEFTLRLLEIAEVLDSIRKITVSMNISLESTAYEVQLDIRNIINRFITAAKSNDYVTIYDLAACDMQALLGKVDSIMMTLAGSV